MLKEGMFIQDRYEIISKIGSGGMADVYKAKDHKLNRMVAVKVLKPEFREDKTFIRKFRTEAQAAAGLSHPNIVNVYDVGEDRGVYYIVMELVEGITLKDYIKKPKENGYRSLHLIVEVPIFLENEKRPMKVEVQLRTIAMDFWASLEHKLRYKKEIPETEAVQMAEELTECANVIADWDKKMGEIRNRIERYSEEKDESLPAIGLARIINRD